MARFNYSQQLCMCIFAQQCVPQKAQLLTILLLAAVWRATERLNAVRRSRLSAPF